MPNPGWFPDPNGAPQERWWDGQVWTEATRPYQTPQYPQTGYGQPVQPIAPPLAYVPAAMAAPAPTRQVDGVVAAQRGFILGLVGVGLTVVAALMLLFGAKVYTLNWMLVISVLLFTPAATVVGIIGIVQAAGGLRRTGPGDAHRRALTGLFLSILAAGTVVVLGGVSVLSWLFS